MNITRSTLTVIISAAATTLALGACVVSKPQDPAASQSAAASTPPPSTSTDIIPTAPGHCPGEIPPVPLFSVPAIDVFVPNADKVVIQTVSSFLQSVPGITVSPAKCDGNVFVSGSMVFGSDDLISTLTGDGVVINNGNGAGSIVEGLITITYGGDGSGSYVNSDTHVSLFILSDGGGIYSAGPVNVFIDNRGHDNYPNPETDESIVNNSDGSGNYSVGKTLIYNDRDGSGSCSDGTLSIINYGDGTALVNGVTITDVLRVEPPPALGKFPSMEPLKPVESCGTVIILEDDVLFDFGKSDIRSDAAYTLSKLATVPNDTKVPVAYIYGHTDPISDEAFNLQLPQERVDAVSAELKRSSVSAILDATGYGESKPVAPSENADGSDNPAGRALNRRVEIFIPAF